MVKIQSTVSRPPKINSEENSDSECQKCISEILNCLKKYNITCETGYTILDECKKRINISCGQTNLKDIL